jgi:predicted O-methyltransferase YrrM
MFSGRFDRRSRISTWNDPEVFQVTTAQWPWEIAALAEAVRKLEPRLICEIGVQEGGTLRYWMQAAPEAIIIAIDPEQFESEPHGRNLRRLIGLSTDDKALEFVRASSPLDFLFIDGDHSYQGAFSDFTRYAPLVRPGGLIALHDIRTYRDDCGVPRLWQEIQSAGYITQELNGAQTENNPGGGIGLVWL